jgi:hypothetical protein
MRIIRWSNGRLNRECRYPLAIDSLPVDAVIAALYPRAISLFPDQQHENIRILFRAGLFAQCLPAFPSLPLHELLTSNAIYTTKYTLL